MAIPRTPAARIPLSFSSPPPPPPRTAPIQGGSGGGAAAQGTTTGATSQSSNRPPLDLSLTTPYQDVINLQTKEGISMFKAASGEYLTDEDRIECTSENSNSFIEHFIEATNRYSLSLPVSSVPIGFALVANAEGVLVPRAQSVASILTSKEVNESDVLLQAHLVFAQIAPGLPPALADIENLRAQAIDLTQPKEILALTDANSVGQRSQYSRRLRRSSSAMAERP